MLCGDSYALWCILFGTVYSPYSPYFGLCPKSLSLVRAKSCNLQHLGLFAHTNSSRLPQMHVNQHTGFAQTMPSSSGKSQEEIQKESQEENQKNQKATASIQPVVGCY